MKTGSKKAVARNPEDGWFIRDLETDTVTCPASSTMHKKCVKSNGYTRYIAKAACSRCGNFRRCYQGKGKWKEIDFAKGAIYVRCRNWTKEA